MTKTCPVNRCNQQLKAAWNLVCLYHWKLLPSPLQDEVWRLFKAERGSGAHLRCVAECLIYLNTLESET
jgi:hypothetical protein